jgi:hypothetical protein
MPTAEQVYDAQFNGKSSSLVTKDFWPGLQQVIIIAGFVDRYGPV